MDTDMELFRDTIGEQRLVDIQTINGIIPGTIEEEGANRLHPD